MRRLEKATAALTAPPWHAWYLVPTGLVVLPIHRFLFGADASISALVAVFFGVLLSVRLGTAVFRRGLPVSKAVRDAWFQNRVLAKHYDSYQWQKLLCIGTGMALYMGFSGRPLSASHATLMIVCMFLGAAGRIVWKRNAAGRR
jgi:hypothetical protein